ncbi:hypothetical protein PanWU01x14_119470 [Parasponia andersonii]|uniref:Uncharacterized protein n=1 Tax=Parasponia andersonii TaxID=3476 RepID=A0A2P5CVE9_PARAD|nr:hypothetical protein PanWU01x14_119470 [Parasponia andersonii]
MTTATMNTLVLAGSSKISKLRNWWLALWGLRVPSKFTIAANLAEKGVKCSMVYKSLPELVVRGGEVKETWSQSFCWVHLSKYKSHKFSSSILYLFDHLNREDFEITTIILWFLWRQRNNHLDGNHI